MLYFRNNLVSGIIFSVLLILVKLFNSSYVHRRYAVERQKQAQSHYNRQIQNCYKFLPNVPAQDRILFDSSPDEMLANTRNKAKDGFQW